MLKVSTSGCSNNFDISSFAGSFPCQGRTDCLLCEQLFPIRQIKLNINRGFFTWDIRGDFNCNSINCVYLAICNICDMRYVGETFNFRDRMNNHASQQFSNPSSSFYKHRMLTNHNFRDFRLIILMGNLSRDKTILRNWESFFIDRLETLHPVGLNFQDEI
jgi:hypothetical protein